MTTQSHAAARDFEEIPIYYPEVRPGYAGWVSLFDFGNGDLGCAINEIRKAPSPDVRPPSLEFMEAMVLPYQFGSAETADADPTLVGEYVCTRSSDAGKTWDVTGRSVVHTRHYWHVGFPDGRMIRIYGTSFMGWLGDDRNKVVVEESTDGGTEWQEISRLLDGYSMNMLKVKSLSDGSVVMAGPIRQAFGAGTDRATRSTEPPHKAHSHDPAFLISQDGGRTWDGPHYVFPGILAWEFDFVELAGGDLLFINSQIQSGPAARQVVKRTATGFINEPVMWIRRGATEDPLNWPESLVPETVCITPDGLLVGALRMRPYACSADLGENWYEIDGLPSSNYQPMMIALPDGRFLNAWHTGHDHHFGSFDMFTGIHAFRLAANLPKPTKLTIERQKNAEGDHFLNVYQARLTSGDQGVAGRRISLRVSPNVLPTSTGESRLNPIDVRDSDDVRTATTDENGIARFELPDIDAHPHCSFSYRLATSFTPGEGDEYAACLGPKRSAYSLTPTRDRPWTYPVYIMSGIIMIVPEVEERFPELIGLIEACDKESEELPLALWRERVDSEERLGEIVDFLVENHIAIRNDDGTCRWYSYHKYYGKVVCGARVCYLEEHFV